MVVNVDNGNGNDNGRASHEGDLCMRLYVIIDDMYSTQYIDTG